MLNHNAENWSEKLDVNIINRLGNTPLLTFIQTYKKRWADDNGAIVYALIKSDGTNWKNKIDVNYKFLRDGINTPNSTSLNLK